ncbi:MAG: PaaI family thioesterase [Arenimonas sp.]
MSLISEIPNIDIKTATGLEQLRALLVSDKHPGIAEALQFKLVEVDEGFAAFEGVPGQHAYNPIGMVHGGYAATLLDSACGCAVHASLLPMHSYSTLEIKVAYHKALTDKIGKVRAEGRVISIGKRVAFAEAKLMDAMGKVYASATSTLLVMAL